MEFRRSKRRRSADSEDSETGQDDAQLGDDGRHVPPTSFDDKASIMREAWLYLKYAARYWDYLKGLRPTSMRTVSARVHFSKLEAAMRRVSGTSFNDDDVLVDEQTWSSFHERAKRHLFADMHTVDVADAEPSSSLVESTNAKRVLGPLLWTSVRLVLSCGPSPGSARSLLWETAECFLFCECGREAQEFLQKTEVAKSSSSKETAECERSDMCLLFALHEHTKAESTSERSFRKAMWGGLLKHCVPPPDTDWTPRAYFPVSYWDDILCRRGVGLSRHFLETQSWNFPAKSRKELMRIAYRHVAEDVGISDAQRVIDTARAWSLPALAILPALFMFSLRRRVSTPPSAFDDAFHMFNLLSMCASADCLTTFTVKCVKAYVDRCSRRPAVYRSNTPPSPFVFMPLVNVIFVNESHFRGTACDFLKQIDDDANK